MAYDTDELIKLASKAIQALPKISKPQIRSIKKRLTMDESGIDGQLMSEKVVSVGVETFQIPDILGYLQNRTELTRSTLVAILTQSKRLGDALINPQLFLDLSVKAIQSVLSSMMIDGIRYSKIGTTEYEMRLFDEEDFSVFLDGNSFEVSNSAKTIYDNYIPLDSDTESQFAKDCENSEQVEFYFKLPNWFKIPTPIGSYNPDWALIFTGEKRIYFVAETKKTLDSINLRGFENLKIQCGTRHFEQLDGVKYRAVSSLGDLVEADQ